MRWRFMRATWRQRRFPQAAATDVTLSYAAGPEQVRGAEFCQAARSSLRRMFPDFVTTFTFATLFLAPVLGYPRNNFPLQLLP